MTLIHNGIYKLVITLSAHDTGQRLQLKTSMKGVGQGKRQAKPWLQETTEETTTSMGSHPRGHQRKAAQCWPYQTHNPVNLPRQNVICFFSFFFSSVFFFFSSKPKKGENEFSPTILNLICTSKPSVGLAGSAHPGSEPSQLSASTTEIQTGLQQLA